MHTSSSSPRCTGPVCLSSRTEIGRTGSRDRSFANVQLPPKSLDLSTGPESRENSRFDRERCSNGLEFTRELNYPPRRAATKGFFVTVQLTFEGRARYHVPFPLIRRDDFAHLERPNGSSLSRTPTVSLGTRTKSHNRG